LAGRNTEKQAQSVDNTSRKASESSENGNACALIVRQKGTFPSDNRRPAG
jgi:hypothetical protein